LDRDLGDIGIPSQPIALEFVGVAIIIISGIRASIFFIKGGLKFHNRLVSLTLAEGMNMSLGFCWPPRYPLSIITKTIPNFVSCWQA
jgi:hypothetical protein